MKFRTLSLLATFLSSAAAALAPACGGDTFVRAGAGGSEGQAGGAPTDGKPGASGAAGQGAAGQAGAAGGSGAAGAGGQLGVGGNAGAGGEGGAGGEDGGSFLSGCPRGIPSAGGVCPKLELECSYGASVDVSCRVIARCDNEKIWDISTPKCAGNSLACGSMPPSGACTTAGETCSYGNGTFCECGVCTGGACPVNQTKVWSCAPPPKGEGCPPIAPNAGVPCEALSSVMCSYGLGCGASRIDAACVAGSWSWSEAPCPLVRP